MFHTVVPGLPSPPPLAAAPPAAIARIDGKALGRRSICHRPCRAPGCDCPRRCRPRLTLQVCTSEVSEPQNTRPPQTDAQATRDPPWGDFLGDRGGLGERKRWRRAGIPASAATKPGRSPAGRGSPSPPGPDGTRRGGCARP